MLEVIRTLSDPENFEAHPHYYDETLKINGKIIKFRDLYSKAIALISSSSAQDIKKAKAIFHKLRKAQPKFTDSYFQLARLAFLQGNVEEADEVLRSGLNEGFAHPSHLFLMVVLCFIQGNDDEATEIKDFFITDYFDRYPKSDELKRFYAPSYKIYKGAKKLELFISKILNNILQEHYLIGRTVLSKTHLIDKLNDTQSWAALDEKKTVIVSLQNLLRETPNFYQVRHYLIKYFIEKNQGKKAYKYAVESADFSSLDWPNFILAGLLSLEQDEVKEASKFFAKASIANAKIPFFNQSTNKEISYAKTWFKNLLNSVPSNSDIYRDELSYPDYEVTQTAENNAKLSEKLKLVAADISQTLSHHSAWTAIAKNDISSKYKRTVIGPFWITLGTGIFLTGMSLVWSKLFSMPMSDYFPYITAGYITWIFISTIMLEATNIFQEGQSILKNFALSKSFHIARLLVRNILIFFHLLPIFLIAALLFNVPANLNTLLFIPGFLLLVFTAIPVALFFGITGLRFRDFGQALNSFLILALLVTPIFWKVEQLGNRGSLAFLNPLTHYISIVREPLLGLAPLPISYGIVFFVGILLWALAIFIFSQTRHRIIFWT